jgi:hypothetical protein
MRITKKYERTFLNPPGVLTVTQPGTFPSPRVDKEKSFKSRSKVIQIRVNGQISSLK